MTRGGFTKLDESHEAREAEFITDMAITMGLLAGRDDFGSGRMGESIAIGYIGIKSEYWSQGSRFGVRRN